MEDTKLCKFCAETIQAAAIKCKHCGSDLSGTKNEVPPTQVIVENSSLVDKVVDIVISGVIALFIGAALYHMLFG